MSKDKKKTKNKNVEIVDNWIDTSIKLHYSEQEFLLMNEKNKK